MMLMNNFYSLKTVFHHPIISWSAQAAIMIQQAGDLTTLCLLLLEIEYQIKVLAGLVSSEASFSGFLLARSSHGLPCTHACLCSGFLLR